MVEPHEKPMKMQWITVDGRSVPIVLPQIWDYELEDWVVTSTANPIPTQLTGSLMEHAGNALSEAPDPTTVPVGAEFTDVTAEIIYKNTGTEWKQWVVL